MEMKRYLAVAALLMGMAAATTVHAQEPYPARPIKMICGFPAGSSLDVITRIYAARLEKALGQPVVVENRVGASGNLAAETVARSAPDGYTLLTNGVTLPISMSLFKKLPFDVINDFTPIGFMGNIPIILAASPALGINSVAELIALAKSRPGELTHGSAGIGSIQHLSGELFNTMAGVKLEGGQAQDARRDVGQAFDALSRSSGIVGIGAARIRRAALVRHMGPKEHAAADRRGDLQRDERSTRDGRGTGTAGRRRDRGGVHDDG
jgi:tripartite-type tricarboxylate transporter receptor subunit TctC